MKQLKYSIRLLLFSYNMRLRLYLILIIGSFIAEYRKLMGWLECRFVELVKETNHYWKQNSKTIKRSVGIVPLLLYISIQQSGAQFVTWAFHVDLPVTQIENTAYKVLWNNRHADKLNDIKINREKTLAYLMTVEEVQRKIYNTLSNVSGAVKDGKTMVAITKKIPLVLDNLQQSIQLAAGKPYMLPLVQDIYQVFYMRILNLSTYLKDVVLSSDEKILIDPVRRHQLVYDVYNEINVLYQLSQSVLNQYQLHTLQDAIDKIIPASTFYNIDKMLVQDIIRKIKLF